MTNISISKTFQRKAEAYSLDVRRWEFFFRKNISPKCFFGHVECSFDNPVSILSPDGQKFFSTGQKTKFSYGNFFLKAFFCTRITQFWLARLLSFARKLIIFSSVSPKDKKNIYFFPKKLFFVKVFFWTLTKHSDKRFKNVWTEGWNVFAQFSLNKSFVEILSLIKIIPWTQKMQF